MALYNLNCVESDDKLHNQPLTWTDSVACSCQRRQSIFRCFQPMMQPLAPAVCSFVHTDSFSMSRHCCYSEIILRTVFPSLL